VELAPPKFSGTQAMDRGVTENGEQPFLFARGLRGSQVVSWIRTHHYVFELYDGVLIFISLLLALALERQPVH
jgi:hypothetical protein